MRKRIYKHNRRKNAIGGDSVKRISVWAKSQEKKCYWCGVRCNDYHIDHYIPLSLGGLNVIENLVISCKICNLSKGPKDPQGFAFSMGRLF